jgi:Tfp pilus assembly protein PilF
MFPQSFSAEADMDDSRLGRCFNFGHFELYPEVCQLYHRGRQLTTCHPQQAAFLAILAETPGVMVSKHEVASRLWPHETPSKNRLNALASASWGILGDDNPKKRKYFASAGRGGYCFVCPVEHSNHEESKQNGLAEKAYRAGKHCLDNRQESSLLEATSSFKKALDHNPSHALAWVGLADAYIMLGIHCVEVPAEAFRKARSAAQSAIRIKPAMPEALASLAWVELCYDRNWRAAHMGFQLALQTKPGYPFAHNGRALLQLVAGRADDTVFSIEKACKLSPLSSPLNALLCHSLYLSRRFAEAERAGIKAILSDPDSCIAHSSLAHALLKLGHDKDAMHHFEEARRLSCDSKVYLGVWAYACALLDRPEEARQALERLLTFPSHDYVPSYFVALIHLGLDQVDECIIWLNRACDERSHWVLFLNSDPIFDGVRASVNFQRLLDKVGFNRDSEEDARKPSERLLC